MARDLNSTLTSSPGLPSPQQPVSARPNPAEPAAPHPNTTVEDRRLLAVNRGHQSLGRVGDFWALVAMAGSIQDTKATLVDIVEAKLQLEASLREMRELHAQHETLTIAHGARTTDLDQREAASLLSIATATADAQNRLAATAQREDDATMRENAISVRENAVTAREAKMDKDTRAAAAQLAADRAELQEIADQLSIRRADIDTRSAALDKRLAAARQFLGINDLTTTEATDVGGLDTAANTG